MVQSVPMTLSDIATSARLPRLPPSNSHTSSLTRLANFLQQAPQIHMRSSCGQYKQESFWHTGPVSSLTFSSSGGNQLASGSWEKTMWVWNIFGRSGAVEPFSLNSGVLALTFGPDGKVVAVSTLDGQITFFDI